MLVIISSFTHAFWNFLTKKAIEKDIFIGLSKITEVAIFFIPFLVLVTRSPFKIVKYWYFIVIAAVFVFLNYVLLSQAYKHIDLSLAYPISRSSTLFLPLVAFLLLRETIDRIGWLSIMLILSGVFLMYVDDLTRYGIMALKNFGLLFALLAALTVACYTVWDKMAITHLHPFVYFYSYTFLTGTFYGLFLFQKQKRAKIHREWSQKKHSIVAVALLNTGTYLLVLLALSLSKAIYVGALRQLSLAFAVFLGWKVLHERVSFARFVGIIVLSAGSTLTLISG